MRIARVLCFFTPPQKNEKRKKGTVPFFRFQKKGSVPFFRFRKKGTVPFFRFFLAKIWFS